MTIGSTVETSMNYLFSSLSGKEKRSNRFFENDFSDLKMKMKKIFNNGKIQYQLKLECLEDYLQKLDKK
jgi:hypothetical protein